MARRAHRRAEFASAEVVPGRQGPGRQLRPVDVGGAQVWTPTSIIRDWQTQAWEYERTVGELHNGLNWQASAVSRAVLFVAQTNDDGTIGEPTDDDRVIAATDSLLARATQPDFLYPAGYNIALAGDFYLYGRRATGDQETGIEWRIVSCEDIQRDGNGAIKIRVDDGQFVTFRRGREVLFRIWQPDPRHWWEPTSQVRALLGVLCDIAKLTTLISSIADSRLRGSGIGWIDDTIDFPPASPEQDSWSSAQRLQAELVRVASAAIADPASAAAWVPIMVKGRRPEGGGDPIEFMSFGTDFPRMLKDLLDASIRRLALGMAVPPGIILGTEDVNHWGQWHLEEEAIKVAIAPIAETIAAGLAERWLPAVLRAVDIDPDGWTIGVDLTPFQQRPDRSNIALELARLEPPRISDEALLRELGFDEDDAPDRTDEPEPAEPERDDEAEDVAPDGRSDNTPPDDQQPVNAASVASLTFAAEVAAHAALARYGNRLRGSTHAAKRTYADVPAHQIHMQATASERARVDCDSWPDGVADALAAAAGRAGFDPECVHAEVAAQVRYAARAGRTFDPRRLNLNRCETCDA